MRLSVALLGSILFTSVFAGPVPDQGTLPSDHHKATLPAYDVPAGQALSLTGQPSAPDVLVRDESGRLIRYTANSEVMTLPVHSRDIQIQLANPLKVDLQYQRLPVSETRPTTALNVERIIPGQLLVRRDRPGSRGRLIELAGLGRDATILEAQRMRASGQYRYVEFNSIVMPAAYENQWMLQTVRPTGAWHYTTGGARVAVLDTTFWLEHPAFEGVFNLADRFDAKPNTEDNRDVSALALYERSGVLQNHGSGTASMVATALAAHSEIMGLAYGSPITPIQIGAEDSDGGTATNVMIEAMRFALGLPTDAGITASQPVSVINVSYENKTSFDFAAEAYEEFIAEGANLVFSVGNSSLRRNLAQDKVPGVILVGAVQSDLTRARFSNTSPDLDLVAPGRYDGQLRSGAHLASAYERDGQIVHYIDVNGEGTSVAAPQVTAAIALAFSLRPDLTPPQIEQIIHAGTATRDTGPAGFDEDTGYGVLDATRMVHAARDFGQGDETTRDIDNDGVVDRDDVDDDGDGVADGDDAFPADPSESRDTDGDGLGDDFADLDDDGDGIPDSQDTDFDNDGTDNDADAFPNDPSEQSDLDGDGVGDNADPDRDGDGMPNEADAFPDDPAEDSDLDGDGVGDNADPDRDGDGTPNEADAFPDDATEQSDTDGDGIGDRADSDDDGDGVPDDDDAFPLDATEHSDADGDGVGDQADNDDDNDGVADEHDYAPLDPAQSAPPANESEGGEGAGPISLISLIILLVAGGRRRQIRRR